MRILIVALIFISSFVSAKTVKIKPSDSSLTYVGRHIIEDGAVYFAHPGFQVKFKFQGTELKFGLSDISDGGPEHNNLCNVFVDGIFVDSIITSTITGWYKVNYTFPDKKVEITLFKRTEAMCAAGMFHGLKVNEGAQIEKVNLPDRKIEWIGDSYSAGYGNLVTIPVGKNPGTGFHSKNEDNSKAWGSIASRALNAQYACHVYSGRGIYRNWNGSKEGTVPSFYDRVIPEGEHNQKWDFSYQPNLVVVFLGTNDFGPETHPTPVDVDSALFVNTYVEFLNDIKSKNPEAKILVVGGGMSDSYPAGKMRLTRSVRFIKAVLTEFEKIHPQSTSFHVLAPFLPPYGEDWHPTVRTQQQMADEIVPVIQKFMGW